MAQDRDKQMPEKYGCICSALHTEKEPNLETRVIQFSNGFFILICFGAAPQLLCQHVCHIK